MSLMFVYVLHMSKISLTRDEAVRRLQTVESDIRRLGVRRLALFGSVIRNEARSDSDVDVLVEFVPTDVRSLHGAGGPARRHVGAPG